MIALGIDYPLNLAFNVRGQIGQYRRGGSALCKRFAVDRPVLRMRRKEESVGDVLLLVSHDVEYGGPAFLQTLEHVAIPLHRRHDQWRPERHLRHPRDPPRAVAVPDSPRPPGYAVREQADRFLSRPRVHILTCGIYER